ncbi:MAG: helix-turn-helix transcriptional regulator [Rhodobiaceae bacterium]|nr:helix-turn-helix transcriptional regulator [Rhodobiaceae bacterium]
MSATALSDVFGALADRHRLAIVEKLRTGGEVPVGELASDLPLTAPAVTHHIRVLEKAGLVERRAHRQQRLIRLRPAALEAVDDWLGAYRTYWSGALDRLERELQSRKKETP